MMQVISYSTECLSWTILKTLRLNGDTCKKRLAARFDASSQTHMNNVATTSEGPIGRLDVQCLISFAIITRPRFDLTVRSRDSVERNFIDGPSH